MTVVAVQRQVGRRVAELRLARALTQERFAESMGLQTSYVQRVEAGEQNLTIRTMVRFAAALGCDSVAELLVVPQVDVRSSDGT